MSLNNRMIWSEGLFIKPQHFQQQQRYIEKMIETRLSYIGQYSFGFTQLEINLEHLDFGQITLQGAKGTMPDGTVFSIPGVDEVSSSLQITDGALVGKKVYLAIPLSGETIIEIGDGEAHTRYKRKSLEIRDIHTIQGDTTLVDVSMLNFKLIIGEDGGDHSSYSKLAIARISNIEPNTGKVILDPEFIPCNQKISAVQKLSRFAKEMASLVEERAKAIAKRINSPSQEGIADVSDFMLLQALNSFQPRIKHLSEQGDNIHPERFYEFLVGVCGELATFTDSTRLAPSFEIYNHAHPTESFNSVMQKMRSLLNIVLTARAIQIKLQEMKYGVLAGPITDPELKKNADFIIAVKANITQDELRQNFIQQVKVTSVEGIRELISLQLPGIMLTPLPVAPRQLPFHSDYIYYRVDRNDPQWEKISNSSGFAFHVAGELPGLEIQLWAIRGE